MSRPPAEPPRPVSRPGWAMPGVDQVVTAGDEVRERVGLVLHPPVLVPGAAHLPAAADVGDGEDDAAVVEREPMGPERRVDADLVGPVAEEQRGGRQFQVLAVDHRDRDPRPVRGDGPLPVGGVAGGVEVAQHGLLLEQRLLALVQRDLQDARRCHQRRAPEAQHRRVGLGVGPEPGRRRRLDRLDDPAGAEQVAGERVVLVGQREDAHLGLGLGTLAQDEGAAEGVDVLNAGPGAVRDHLAPGRRVIGRRPVRRPEPPGPGSPGPPRWSGPGTSPRRRPA